LTIQVDTRRTADVGRSDGGDVPDEGGEFFAELPGRVPEETAPEAGDLGGDEPGPECQCAGDDDCPVPDTPCLTPICQDCVCLTEPRSGQNCDDGNQCTYGDLCIEGLCLGTAYQCEDGLPCTVDICSTTTGGCVFQPMAEGIECDDLNGCTDDDQCNADGQCVGTLQTCQDLNPCTTSVCHPTLGCVHEPVEDDTPCYDGDDCTVADYCQDGACLPGGALDCDDSNLCTDDACQPGTGCLHTPNQEPCEDGIAFTEDDTCVDGVCLPGTLAPVTCNGTDDCQFLEDDDLCNGQFACVEGLCAISADSIPDCSQDEADPCLISACSPETGLCESAAGNQGAPCDDGDPCTLDETCLEGTCLPGPALLDCDDSNPCTDDQCVELQGCTHDFNLAECEDGNACTDEDRCSGGSCQPGDPLLCYDGNQCTVDSCYPEQGCIFLPIPLACDDGDSCTLDDACLDGECLGGTVLDCDDGNLCTDDLCDLVAGCVHQLNQADCDDSNPCTVDDQCAAGTCVAGPLMSCDDGNSCTIDQCDPESGCQWEPMPDSQPCIYEDEGVAKLGACQEGTCACTPHCGDKLCGDDGCKGSCGECDCTEECLDGQCEYTACTGRECGPDGCGGSCGTCASGSCHQKHGLCVPDGFILVPPQTFTMGSPDDEKCQQKDEEPQHEIATTRFFAIKEHEVTQDEWNEVTATAPSWFLAGEPGNNCSGSCPAERVNWYEAAKYCNLLSAAEGLNKCYIMEDCQGELGSGCPAAISCAGDYLCTVELISLDCPGYRLPTEAEWELAARSGTETAVGTGDLSACSCEVIDELDAIAWYCANAESTTHEVGFKDPTDWGLHDVNGNVWEWVHDVYDSDYYEVSPAEDPLGPTEGPKQVIRGGSWNYIAKGCRNAARASKTPETRSFEVGFRPVRTITLPK